MFTYIDLTIIVHRNLYLSSFLNLFTLPKSSLRYWVRDSLMYIAESWWMLFPISQATDGSTLAFFPPRCLRDLQNQSRFSLRTNLTINLSLSVPLVSGNRWAIAMSCLSIVTPMSWPIFCVRFAGETKGNIGIPEISRQSLLEHCWMESMAASASQTEPLRWLILLSWASHQLLRSFICFLVDCIDFKTESYLSLINCCDDCPLNRVETL